MGHPFLALSDRCGQWIARIKWMTGHLCDLLMSYKK